MWPFRDNITDDDQSYDNVRLSLDRKKFGSYAKTYRALSKDWRTTMTLGAFLALQIGLCEEMVCLIEERKE